MRAVCTECEAKRGRISTKSIPGIGKSGNWRSEARSSGELELAQLSG